MTCNNQPVYDAAKFEDENKNPVMQEGVILSVKNISVSAVNLDRPRPHRQQPINFSIAHAEKYRPLVMPGFGERKPGRCRQHLLNADPEVQAQQHRVLKVDESAMFIINPARHRAGIDPDQAGRI